jgi:hypothetical protein
MCKKTCNKCGIEKSVDGFLNEKKKNSKGEVVYYMRGVCNSCIYSKKRELYKPKTKLKEKLKAKLASKTKVCFKCGEEKEKTSEFFHSDKQKIDGFSSSCKACKNKQNFERTQTKEYKDYKSEYDKKFRKTESGIRIAKNTKERRVKLYNSDEEYRQKELDRYKGYRDKDRANGSPVRKASQKRVKVRYRSDPKFREKQLKKQREYRKNKDVYKEWNKAYIKKNKHKFACRQMLKDFLRRVSQGKEDRTHVMLGYSFEQFKKRMEMNFKPGMSWDNHGDWHIDHIKPVARFDNDTPANIVNALCNLQPLWAEENLLKGDDF